MDRDFLALLDQSPLLQSLDPLSRTALGMHFRSARYAPGETLMAAGAQGDRLILVLKGQAQVHLSGQAPPLILGPDSLLGEVAFFGRVPGRTATVTAQGEVVAAVLTRETYDEMVRVDPGAAETLEKLILRLLIQRVAQTNARTVALLAQHESDPVFQAEARMMARSV